MHCLTSTTPAGKILAARRLRAPIDPGMMEQSLRLAAARHESLRTGLVRKGDQLMQTIAPEAPVTLRVVDLVDLPVEEGLLRVDAITAEEVQRPFQVEHPPLFHSVLARLASDDFVLLVTLLHSIFDEFSQQLLVGELRALYARVAGAPHARTLAPPTQFRQLSGWQLAWERDPRLRGQYEYWSRKLEGYQAKIDLPVRRPRPEVSIDTRALFRAILPADRWKAALALARSEAVTPFALLLAALALVLADQSGQDEIVLGAVYANRRLPFTQSIMGLVMNILLLRANLAGDPTLRQFLKQVTRDWLEALENGELPFEELARRFGVSRVVRGSAPAYEALVNFNVSSALSDDDRPSWMQPWVPTRQPEPTPCAWAGCPLFLTLFVTAEGSLRVDFRYTEELLERAVISRLAALYLDLLGELPRLLDTPVSRLGAVFSRAAAASP